MDSWSTTLRLVMVMAAVAVSYVVGALAGGDAARRFSASGSLPSF